MAVSIRLRREGTKNRPYYRVIVADKRSPRDGKFIEAIGNYDPRVINNNFKIDLGRVDHWIKNGAQPSATVASMILKARKSAAAAAAATPAPVVLAAPAVAVE
jgi:small subunit ribosomal protein S16